MADNDDQVRKDRRKTICRTTAVMIFGLVSGVVLVSLMAWVLNAMQ